MEHVEGRFTGAGGGQIYWQGWLPDGDVNGVVVISHGYAEHGGRYAHVAERLGSSGGTPDNEGVAGGGGYACYAVDHRGHGRSDGRRGNVNRMSEVRIDLDRVIKLAAAKHPGVPVFLLGHSLGGLIALDYVTSTDHSHLRGLLLSGAFLIPSVGSKVERVAAKVLSSVAPNLGVVAPLDSSTISRDAAVVAAYDADPLNYRGKIGARIGAEGLAAIDRVTARLKTLELPILVMHGVADQLSDPAAAQLVADGVSSQDLTVKLYDDLYHEIFNEPEQDVVLGDVAEWLKTHT